MSSVWKCDISIFLLICGMLSFVPAESSAQVCSLFVFAVLSCSHERPIHSRSWMLLECSSSSVLIHPQLEKESQVIGQVTPDMTTPELARRQPCWHAVPEQCMVVESSAQGKEPSLVYISAGAHAWAQQTSLWSACFVLGYWWVHICQSQQCISEL